MYIEEIISKRAIRTKATRSQKWFCFVCNTTLLLVLNYFNQKRENEHHLDKSKMIITSGKSKAILVNYNMKTVDNSFSQVKDLNTHTHPPRLDSQKQQKKKRKKENQKGQKLK